MADCPLITLVADDSIITANVTLTVFFVTGTISRLIFARVYPGKNQYPAIDFKGKENCYKCIFGWDESELVVD